MPDISQRLDHLPSTPFDMFNQWFATASRDIKPYPSAMTLSTVGGDGRPSSRVVLLKEWDEEGFVFYTHMTSRKGMAMKDNPHVALNFYWPALNRQIRIEGRVWQIDNTHADLYFASRPRQSQIGAWASKQSAEMASKEGFEAACKEFDQQFKGQDIPRPPHWSGYCVTPDYFEFWQEGEHRLHDRVAYHLRDKEKADSWVKKRLYP